jgi:hypothetical protein
MYQLSRIAEAILDYLWNHPNAQDTQAGIADWWLPEQRIKTRRAQVKEALNELVSHSLVVERKGADSQVRYRINKRRLKEIELIVKRSGK